MDLAYLSQSLADIERTETMSSSISHLSSQSNSACLTIFRCLFPHGLCTVSRKMQWRRLGRTYEHLNLCDKVEIVRRRTSQRRTCRPRVITGTGGVELIPASMASSKSRGLASTTIVRLSQCLVAHPPTCGELSGLIGARLPGLGRQAIPRHLWPGAAFGSNALHQDMCVVHSHNLSPILPALPRKSA